MNSCIKSILPEGASPMDVPWMVISAIMPAFKVISRSVDGVCMMWYWWHLGALYQWLNFKYQCLVFCQFMNNDYQYYQWVLVVINMNCTVDGYEDFNYPAFVISFILSGLYEWVCYNCLLCHGKTSFIGSMLFEYHSALANKKRVNQ
jgi:hypothetical protein